MIRWLLVAKKVRAGREPEDEIVVEVFRGNAGKWACPRCGHTGLLADPARDETAWADEPLCKVCHGVIPRERLLAVPDATLCAACQREEELGRSSTEPRYCPQCGAPMELQPSTSRGSSRYVWRCKTHPTGHH